MEFREFKYISTIAETGSFTKASQKLFVSQPSLSHLVARTESQLGVPIFDRSTNPLTLTYAGEVYLRHAQDILDSNEMMLREFRDITNNMKGRLRIGMPYERAAYMLPRIIPRFHAEFPGIQLDITDAGTHVLVDMLEKGRIDFAVMPLLETKTSGLESFPIYEEELLLSAARGYIAPDDCLPGDPDTVNFACLRHKPFVLQRRGHVIRDSIDVLLKAYRIKPEVVLEISGNTAAYRLSSSGLGVAIVPHLTTQLAQPAGDGRLYHLTGKVPITWEVRAFYRKDTYVGTVEKRFIEIAREAHN